MKIRKYLPALVSLAVCLAASSVCIGQSADGRTPIFPRQGEKEDQPLPIRESISKMRIEKEKKEYQEMLDRGDEALRISEDLEKAFIENGRLSDREIAQLVTFEKLVKKIRDDLGGSDDDDRAEVAEGGPASATDAIRSLRTAVLGLSDQLKKTTRFTVSADAIYAANEVLRLTRYLKLSK